MVYAMPFPCLIFSNLSLCVCDEQQRFGVAQRSAILDKGSNVDMLVISATPIPRTLSLIFYGDLDISVIKDNRKIKTSPLDSHNKILKCAPLLFAESLLRRD